MICPKCAAVCHEDLRFCDTCGTDLTTHEENIPVILVVEKPVPTVSAPVTVPELPKISASKTGRLWPPLLILSIMILVGSFVFFLLPGASQNQPSSTNQQAWFSVENGALTFHAEYYTGSGELVIPEAVNGQTITSIADYGFSNADAIDTVILPETLLHIGDYAFSSCKNLRGIYVPTTVRSIGAYAFADCDDLEAIYLSDELESIGHDALSSCDSLRYILFNGTYQEWLNLYNGYFVSNVELHAIDGVYYTRP